MSVANSDHETLGQCSRRGVGVKHLPAAYRQVGQHPRKCFTPTGLCQSRVVRFSQPSRRRQARTLNYGLCVCEGATREI